MSALTFGQALTQAEAQARSTLPVELRERLSAAVALVQGGHVFQTSAGDWQVDSSTTEGLTYTCNGTCNCQDAHYNKPPQGLCKHRLGMFLAQRVQTLLAQPPAPVVPEELPEVPDVIEPWPMNDPEDAPEPPPVPSAPVPLPEAPASVNVRVQVAGREVQWTLRDTDEGRLARRLDALLQRYPLPAPPPGPPQGHHQLSPQQHNAAAMHKKVTGFCPVHNVQMKEHTNEKGTWFSHYTDGKHCKGK
jgi:hypothetical protein